MENRYLYLLRYILAITDLLLINAIYFLTVYLLRNESWSLLATRMKHEVVISDLIWLFAALLFGLYSHYGSRKLERIYRATLRSYALHFLLFYAYYALEYQSQQSFTFLFVFYGLLAFSLTLNRFMGTAFQYLVLRRFRINRKVAVMGDNPTGKRLASYFTRRGYVDFYGYIPNDEEDNQEHFSFSGRALKEMEKAAAAGAEELFVAVPPARIGQLHQLMEEADKQCMRIKFVPDIAGSLSSPYHMNYLGAEFPVISLRPEPLESVSARFKKRAFDIIFSSLVIIFLFSWLYPIIALLIKLESRGPVLFKQQRSGRNDQPFWCYKFRSMRVNGDSDSRQASKDDDRITNIGRFLRKTSMDELPQFFNVLWGNMSVVGPRPHMLKHTQEYRAIIDKFMVRHFSKPGITGWAQVNGYRGETKDPHQMEIRVEHDIWYLENWTGMLDVKIIFMTIINVFKGEENAF